MINIFAIVRGTTPKHKFTIGTNLNTCQKILITYSQQNKIILEKDERDLTFSNSDLYSVYFRMTQEETELFSAGQKISMQMRILTSQGWAKASKEIKLDCRDVLNDVILVGNSYEEADDDNTGHHGFFTSDQEFELEFDDSEIIADGGTFNYNDLENLPTINGVSLVGNKTTSDLMISALPSPTPADNGKIAKIVNGQWAISEDLKLSITETINESGGNTLTIGG